MACLPWSEHKNLIYFSCPNRSNIWLYFSKRGNSQLSRHILLYLDRFGQLKKRGPEYDTLLFMISLIEFLHFLKKERSQMMLLADSSGKISNDRICSKVSLHMDFKKICKFEWRHKKICIIAFLYKIDEKNAPNVFLSIFFPKLQY